MTSLPTARIHGQDSFLLETDVVRLALTRTGAMLAPVTFFPDEVNPVTPYAIAPWAEETLLPGIPAMVATLRGDWFCSAFGENSEPYRGHQLPPHGETANLQWHALANEQTSQGCWLRLGLQLP